MFRSTRLFSTGLALIASGALLTACGGGGAGSGSLPATQPNLPQSSSSATNSAHAASVTTNAAPAPCTTQPVKMIQATVTALSVNASAPGNSGTFTVCTQFFTKFTATVDDSKIASATITPSTPVEDQIYTATVTITGLKGGTTTVTIKDKKGNSVTVSITVTSSQTFSYTGGSQTFTVPQGITQITVDAVGASGGRSCFTGGSEIAGGAGFEIKAAHIAVIPGQTLYVYVGGSPVAGTFCLGASSYSAAGFNGGGAAYSNGKDVSAGGGGGASDVRTNTNTLTTSNDTRLIVAGGGGGAIAVFVFSGQPGSGGTGGDGGYPDGAAGGYNYFVGSPDPGALLAGQGGTQDASGGAGGQLPSFPVIGCGGNQGSLGNGGSNTNCRSTGAGGGGYYGGGSGAYYSVVVGNAALLGFGAGGGGSSFVENGAAVVVQQVATPGQCDASNDGCITITW